MITEIKDDYLYIWRDRDEKNSGLEIRISSINGSGALKKLKDRLGTWKFYPALKAISELKTYQMEWRDGIHEWELGLPNFVGKNIKTPEFLNYDPNKAYGSKRAPKDPPAWMRYISDKTKQLKKEVDNQDKMAEDDDWSKMDPYPEEVFEGYAKAKVRFFEEYPNYVPGKFEKKGSIGAMLTKGIIWGILRKYKNIAENDSTPEWKKEHAEKVARLQKGKIRKNEELARKALIKFNAPKSMLDEETEDPDDMSNDAYVTSQAIETENNKLFNTLPIETKLAIMKAAGLTQDDIRKRNAALMVKSDAGNIEKGHKDEDYFYRIKDKYRENIHSFATILDYSRISEQVQVLRELYVKKEIDINSETDLCHYLRRPDFKGIQINYSKSYSKVIISKSSRKNNCFQITFLDEDDKPYNHVTISDSFEPQTDDVFSELYAVQFNYEKFLKSLEKPHETIFLESK